LVQGLAQLARGCRRISQSVQNVWPKLKNCFRLAYPKQTLHRRPRPKLQPVVLHHHEKFDGTGYPQGLCGAQIPLAARLFTVVDVLDALLSERPYKSPMTLSGSLAVIERGAGSHFDPEVVRQFVEFAPGVFEPLHGLSDTTLAQRLEQRRNQVFGI
jgi:HD-GYP domain-containing protein (c-di-GMP phosphodiesterase class II)